MEYPTNETTSKGILPATKIETMREKAVRMGARPVSPDSIKPTRCSQYWVGCDTITAKV